MKHLKKVVVYLFCACLLILTGCEPKEKEEPTKEKEESIKEEPLVKAEFEILDVRDTYLLVVESGNPSNLALVTYGDVLADAKGALVTKEDLKPGMLVELGWNGIVMETYPVQFSFDTLKITEPAGNSAIALYYGLIKGLIERDPGLNANVREVYFDFSKVSTLNEGEKTGLTYMCGNLLECMGQQTNAENLTAEGLMAEGYLEHGLLIAVDELSVADDAITCEISKYRSPLGAYIMEFSCDFDGTQWNYTVKSEAVS